MALFRPKCVALISCLTKHRCLSTDQYVLYSAVNEAFEIFNFLLSKDRCLKIKQISSVVAVSDNRICIFFYKLVFRKKVSCLSLYMA